MKFRVFLSAVFFIAFSSIAHAGFIEVCKDANPAGSLSGLFSFTIAGQAGTFATPVGACTPAIQLPNGTATVTEVPHAGSAFFSVSTFPTTRLISFDPILASAVVQIVAGDISTQTLLDFTNTPFTTPINTGVPEPGTGWLLGLGLIFWAKRQFLS